MAMKLLQRWCLAIPAILGILSSALGQTESATRYSSFEYDGVGMLSAELIEPATPDHCVVTAYDKDDYGNKTRSTTLNCPGASAAAQFTSRSTDSVYGTYSITVGTMAVQVPEGAFPTQIRNSLQQAEERRHDPRFGGLASLTGPNGLTTRWEYDAFGRKVLEISADGNRLVMRHCLLAGQGDASANSAGCIGSPPYAPANAVSYAETQPQDVGGIPSGPYVRKYADSLGRIIREETQGYDGPGQPGAARIVVKDSEYNDFGALVKVTQPYFIDSPAKSSLAGTGAAAAGWTATTYDFLGRVVQVDIRDDEGNLTLGGQAVARKTISYIGLQVTEDTVRTSKNAQGQQQPAQTLTTRRLSNPVGQVIEVKDAVNASLRKRYDPFGNLVETQDGQDNRVRTTYDVRGRRTQMVDPNTGTWKYQYDALGELRRQQNPNQALGDRWTVMSYDVLGRMTQRIEPGDFITTWTYDSCNKGVGKLCSIATDHGSAKTFTYDAFGRPSVSLQNVSGQPSALSATTIYDVRGRVASYTYPTGVALTYTYSPLGFVTEIKRGTESLWRMGASSAWGKPESFDVGADAAQNTRLQYDAVTGRSKQIAAGQSGSILTQTYGWDTVGNLTDRTDRYDGGSNLLSENFGYDQLNRLVNYGTSAPTLPGLTKNVSLTYDAIGNIKSKSDVGNYSYPASGPSSVRPSAVRMVSGAVGTRNYTYDAGGNLVSVAATSTRYSTLTYTSFNLPKTLDGREADYDWGYGPDHERVRETKTTPGNSRVTWYFHPDKANGLAFEQEVLNGGVPVNRHYVSAMGRTVMVFETNGAIGSASAQTQTAAQFWHVDQLGSISAITDAAGVVKQRYSYDPFGKRRSPNGAYDVSGTLIYEQVGSQSTDRGFTGHEHLDDVGIVHMNGRTFDARIARFMQPDPYIQFEDNLQSYNRYSYVLNNPLNATDPTGEFAFILPAIFAAVGYEMAAAVMLNGLVMGATLSLPQMMIAGAVGGAMAASVSGTNLTGAGKSIASGAFGAAAFNVVGTAGGWHNVSTSPAAGLGDWVAKTIAHAVVGCAQSAIGGGACKDGAIGAGAGAALGFVPERAGFDGGGLAIARATIGGVASSVAGGSFASGAFSAAFGYLFNDAGGALSDAAREKWQAAEQRGIADFRATHTRADGWVVQVHPQVSFEIREANGSRKWVPGIPEAGAYNRNTGVVDFLECKGGMCSSFRAGQREYIGKPIERFFFTDKGRLAWATDGQMMTSRNMGEYVVRGEQDGRAAKSSVLKNARRAGRAITFIPF